METSQLLRNLLKNQVVDGDWVPMQRCQTHHKHVCGWRRHTDIAVIETIIRREGKLGAEIQLYAGRV
jgi:hypothetical protein